MSGSATEMRVRAKEVRKTLECPTLSRTTWVISWFFTRSNSSAPWAGRAPRRPRIMVHHNHLNRQAGLSKPAFPLLLAIFAKCFTAA